MNRWSAGPHSETVTVIEQGWGAGRWGSWTNEEERQLGGREPVNY